MTKVRIADALDMEQESDELVWRFDEFHQPHIDYSRSIFSAVAARIAARYDVHPHQVRITYCAPEEEYCIYVDNKWCGYYDVTGTPYEFNK